MCKYCDKNQVTNRWRSIPIFSNPEEHYCPLEPTEKCQKILKQIRSKSRRDSPAVFVCMCSEMERKLFDAFITYREAGKPVRDGWFHCKASIYWTEAYPQLQTHLFLFSSGWFRGYLSRHRIVLRFVTIIAQSSVAYKEQIILWLRFNRRTKFLHHSFHFMCNNTEGLIPNYRICNVDETSLLWEYLLGQTYNLQGAKTV